MKFVLASANPGKVKEMRSILSDIGIEVVSRDELGIDIDVEETGETFFENALLKAKAICKISGLPAIADDSGLVVSALGGQPGIYTSSYGGDHLNNEERYKYLLKNMENMEHRAAKFVCNTVCVFTDGTIISSEGECLGEIALAQQGEGGFGYDPVFIPKDMQRTMAQLSPQEKNEISHRGKAIRELADKLEMRMQK